MTEILKSQRATKSPVLFLTFNRPENTALVFEEIRKARPDRLYVASDGPRTSRSSDQELVTRTRTIATNVDWPCTVKTLFRPQNLGCKQAVGEAITWFFEHEPEGIILEDDCKPNQDFFRFCDSLLERYRDNQEVFAITGNNFQNGNVRNDASYYFSRYPHIWGWATWRRAWQFYDPKISFWPELKKAKHLSKLFASRRAQKYWTWIFDNVYKGVQSTSWDYPWTASVFSRSGLTATPNSNLVSNIGFGPDSTHTKDPTSIQANIPSGLLGTLRHPGSISVDVVADNFTFSSVFDQGLLISPKDYVKAIWKRVKNLGRVPRRAG
jgi:hypothetical protein